ncbi:MAG: VWA domain-containing protein [Planctomycetes bacterium]|nr:VWA domain-containing protein [Planctomycetota bacterium]
MRPGPACALWLALAASAAPARGDDDADRWAAAAVRAASTDPAVRARALEDARVASDLRALDVPVRAAAAAKRDRDRAAAQLATLESDADEAWAARDREVRAFDRLKDPDAAREDAHRRRLSALRDRTEGLEVAADTTSLEVADREEELDTARRVASAVLARVPPDEVADGVARLRAAWVADARAEPEDRVRFVEAIERVRAPGVSEALAALARDARLDARVRAAALDARAARRDEGVLDEAVAATADPSWVVAAAALDVLRTLHEPAAIEPLIAFLRREDLGRLREDAWRALRSLTGERHGPYAEPWAAWWAEHARDFEPPRRPASLAELAAPDSGATFYGITTFSTRIVFTLDVSGSMAEPLRRGAADGARRIDSARREALGALDFLDERGRFGVVLFDRGVRRFAGGLVRADADSRRRAKTWLFEREPRGETNLLDALREAFRMASGLDGAAPPLAGADTVFLLSDGLPTAGGVRSPERIVESVRRWNRSARLVVHCVALGGQDGGLLADIAAATGGRYVRR